MTDETKTIRSSGTPEVEAPPASSRPPATVANLRTLQDVEREIREEMMKLNRLRKQWEDAVSAQKAARTAEELAKAKKSVDAYWCWMDISVKLLDTLFAERARLQATATVSSSEQKSGLFGHTPPREDAKGHSRPTPKPYTPECHLQPDANGELPLSLDAEIEPIPCGPDDSVLPAYTEEQKAVIQWNCAAYDVALSDAVAGFLRNRIQGNITVKESFYSRNNYFLKIIRTVAGAGTTRSVYMTHDHSNPSSQTGPDATIYQSGYPELVVVAEKAVDEVGAESELCDKFVFLAHYGIDRVVGIAIVGNQFKIGYIHRDPKRFEVLMTLTTGEDGNGYTLVQAAVNIGIWFRATMARGDLDPLSFRFGETSATAHRELTIYRHKFRKILYQRGDVNLKALSEFYKSIRSQRIPYFEYPVNDEGKRDSVVLVEDRALDLVMKPVGLAREPSNPGALKNCLLCILTALQDLHGRGYVHLDLRWPNIIHVDRDRVEWYIIDGEYVRKPGDPYPKNHPLDDGDVVDSAVDLTMLGKMLGALDYSYLLTPTVRALIEYLTKGDRSTRTAEEALKIVQGW